VQDHSLRGLWGGGHYQSVDPADVLAHFTTPPAYIRTVGISGVSENLLASEWADMVSRHPLNFGRKGKGADHHPMYEVGPSYKGPRSLRAPEPMYEVGGPEPESAEFADFGWKPFKWASQAATSRAIVHQPTQRSLMVFWLGVFGVDRSDRRGRQRLTRYEAGRTWSLVDT
jgi:hypothetical protein